MEYLGYVISDKEIKMDPEKVRAIKEGRLHPITFHLRKLSPVKLNYDIYNKELLAVVNTFK